MGTPGLPSQVKELRRRVDDVEKALDEEAMKRARIAEEVATLWQRLRWIEKKVEKLLKDVTGG